MSHGGQQSDIIFLTNGASVVGQGMNRLQRIEPSAGAVELEPLRSAVSEA